MMAGLMPLLPASRPSESYGSLPAVPWVGGGVVMADDPCLAASWPVAEPEQANHYYRARYYDPKAGRFISEDPIGFEGGINFYAYVANNPVNVNDPLGLAPVTNNSDRPIPYKPECPVGVCPIQMCQPGQTCDADGVYPSDCKSNPIKIVNGCSGTVLPDGQLVVSCTPPLSNNWQNGKVMAPVMKVVRRFWSGAPDPGGPVDDDFMRRHPDWPPPDSAPNCGCN
jgi:RHS repeat-associated protein